MRQLWTRAAVIALTAGTLGAHAEDARAAGQRFTPNFPITQPPAAQPVPQSTAPASEAVSTAPNEAETLSRPTPISTSAAPSVTQSELPPPARATTSAPAPQLRAAPPRTVVTTTVTGPVVNVPGKPQVRVVESGDALDAIARGFGATRAELVELNDLKPPYRLKLGQKIKGPAKDDQKAYVVQTGDTMFAIAKRFNVTAAALADENDLKAGSAIKKGQKLILPDGYKDKGPIKTTTVLAGAPASQPSSAEAEPTPSRPATTTPSRPTPGSLHPANQLTPTEPGDLGPVSTTTLSVTGSVTTVAGPRQIHTVKSGDTLTAIARKFGVSVSDLADDNKLKTDTPLKLGAKIKGPATTQKAYVAVSGDTLAGIAKRFNVSVKELAAENNLRATASVKKGQKVLLPDGYKDKGPIRTTTTTVAKRPEPTRAPSPSTPSNTYARVDSSAPTAPTPSTPSSPQPYQPSGNSYSRPSAPIAAQPVTPPPSSARPIIESSAAPTEAEIIASGKGKFAWPVRGEIISTFGVKGTGQRNDGLDIRAAQGTPVLSAADGEVAYAGNQVPTFGNLVLVKHADGWVTAYAHLSSINVKMRQAVRQGEQLGAVGATGGTNESKLHFEMRYAPTVKDKAKPVDPALVLPR
ncbi:LysM peptidoglycan-binding domain-containing protein [Caulobacter sp. 602-1]|uniref:cell division endopeptidase DipM n=1 Tax=Caulobacter sp. 602-1 TaxID=2492472 RepID=UPI000F62FFFA|nr:LysM peptidoglycan-binding domain-containing protein [Caulobacter sp. 602-1]RRN65608.1 LysM peptidoglycan-binding domain-containing protein [Caulobacter sp. 602-1]